MVKKYSQVYRVPDYWTVRYDEWKSYEASHIHVTQGGREIQVYVNSLDIKNQDGRFTNDEIEEIKEIAKEYC